MIQNPLLKSLPYPILDKDGLKAKFDKNSFSWNQFFKPNTLKDLGKGIVVFFPKKKHKAALA